MQQKPWYDHVVIPALLRHARTAYGTAMRRALEAEGYDDIPANGLYVIGGLALNEQRDVPLSQLIRELRLSKQAAGVLVETLVGRGYLVREADPSDRRRMTVSLTERGRDAARVQTIGRDSVDADLLERVGAADIVSTRRTLGALCEIAREQREATD